MHKSLTKVFTAFLTITPIMVVSSFTYFLPIKEKERIDEHMETLYLAIKDGDQKKSCREASNAEKLIRRNFNGLKKLEPHYEWRSMKEVLLNIASKNCN